MLKLKNPVKLRELSQVKIQAIHYESNPERGQEWVDVYCEYGAVDDGGVFRSMPLPGTGSALLHFRFEDGMHPAVPGRMLGQCDACGAWHSRNSGECGERGCRGEVAAFRSLAAFRGATDPRRMGDMFAVTEDFLAGTEFPDASDAGTVRPLVDASATREV
jgi:hypothetical protein